jgi:two-component system, cell cycle sensor histidine kinase and response regulator CckA
MNYLCRFSLAFQTLICDALLDMRPLAEEAWTMMPPTSPKATSNRKSDRPEADPETREDRRLEKIGRMLALLGPDPEQNIHIIVEQAYQVFESACALYYKISEQRDFLVFGAGRRLPPGFPPEGLSNGRIFRDAAIKGGNQPTVLEDLSQTAYMESDPFLGRYGLKAYLGCPVSCKGDTIGVLCIADTRARHFSRMDSHIIAMLAKSLSLEEERRQFETDLRKSEARYRRLYKMMRLLTDNVPDLIWAKDLENRYLFVNQALCDMLLKCRRPEEAIGKTDADFVQKELSLGHRHTFGKSGTHSDEITKLNKTAGRFLEEGLVRNEYLVLDVHKAPFWDENGELIGTVGCGRDVTREKQTEKALQESEQRYRDLYNNTPVMLYSLDHEDRVTSVSNHWLEVMGYARDEVIGRRALDFFAPECRKDAVKIYLPEFYRSGQMKDRPFKFVTKNGASKEVLLSAIAQRDADGQYAGALAFVVDVSQSKTSEIEQRRLSARLQQAQKMETISTLAGGIAHQFNNALAVIMGNLELIQMDGLADGKLERFVGPISQASDKMVHLTSQLLAYARGGKFQTQIVPAHGFVREALSLVGHSISSHVEMKVALDETAYPIEVDATQIQMLLSAVLSNASEAIEHKGTVHVSLRNAEVTPEECLKHQGLNPGRYVLLNITDTGKGMDEATRMRVFEPFFTTKFQGRGLGMAAVYGIVKKHGGYVSVASEPGRGTTVSIYLPCALEALQIAEARPPYMAHRTGTALIVEDEQLVMEVNRAIVEKLGYRVLEARSGVEALRIAETHAGAIDFALLDVILPDMSGNQIYPRLMEIIPTLKVIVCSGYTLDGPAREILNAGAQSFLPKPFTVASLAYTLDQILETR